MEDISHELLELLWHFIAGLFPARIKRMASSKGEAHKGKKKKVFCTQWDSLLNQIQQVAFSVYIITSACYGLVKKKKAKQQQKTQTKTPHYHIILHCPLGFTLIFPKILHAHQARQNKKRQNLVMYFKMQRLYAILTPSPAAVKPPNCSCL